MDRATEGPRRVPEVIEGIGEGLRGTFSADNHETIGSDLTRLMLHLSQSSKEELLGADRR